MLPLGWRGATIPFNYVNSGRLYFCRGTLNRNVAHKSRDFITLYAINFNRTAIQLLEDAPGVTRRGTEYGRSG